MAKFSKPGGTLFTQISSGIYKGKKLALPALSSTRSTKSIVKGSFFDTWRAELRGAAFIECFGGSGAMALEALSNGAKNVYAIEKDAAAHKMMRKNFELFGLGANAILGDCFERLPEILHDLQADMNGRSGTNSLNLSGKNFKNHAAAYRKNLDDEKEGCRKSFSGVEQGEDGYCAAQGVGAEDESEYCGASDDTGSRGAPDFGLSGGENFNDTPEKQSAADKILSGLSGDRGAVSCARGGFGADAGFCVDRSLGVDASGTGLNRYFDEKFKNGAQCGASINLNLKNDMRSSVQDSAQNGAQRSVNDGCTGVEDFGGCTQIGDYASTSSIKYRANSLATDAASPNEEFGTDVALTAVFTDNGEDIGREKLGANSSSEYDMNGAKSVNRDVNLSSTCGVSSNFDANRGAGLGMSYEEKENLNLGENFSASYEESLHLNANFVYDSRKNSTENSDGNFSASCGENSRPNVNLTRDSIKNFAANCNENFIRELDESATANSRKNFACGLGESFALNSDKSHTVNSSENSVSDPARRVFVYLDPPFAIRQGFGEIYERVLALIARLGSVQCELLIAIEHMSELEMPPKIGDFALLKSRKFGATTMSYYAK